MLLLLHASFPPRVEAQDLEKVGLIKAAFLYNFVKFVEWPGELGVTGRKSIDICVVGSNPFNGQAISVLREGSTASLALNFVEERSWQNAGNHCHIAYISDSEEGKIAEIAAGLKGKPVLTVSDINGFAEKYGMIGFVLSDNKVKVVVNAKAATNAGLRIDAQLLEIALKVIR